jgi:ribosomal protein S18 acetylase RimI-like enzyme
MGAHGDIGLRASDRADEAFLRAVYESTRADEFSAAGWHADEIGELLATQFSMQEAYYRCQYPRGRFDIVRLEGTAIGRLYHDWAGGEARVIDIALLPAYRGAGIGTRLMRALVAQAARRAMPITLYVEFDNPVRALYRRLGFEPAGENGVYEWMRREAAPFDDAGDFAIAGLANGTDA